MTQDTSNILVGMGNPLLDIVAEVSSEFLTKYGLKSNDAILADAEKHKSLYEDLVKSYKVEFIAGGAAQNSIRGAQWMLPAKSTSYFGCVGQDRYAQIMKEAAAKDGVHVEYLEVEEVPTGTCAVLINEGGQARSLVANLSAANNYKVSHMKEHWSVVEEAKFFYTSGFFLTVSVETMLAVALHAEQQKKTFAFNLSAPFLCQFFKDQMLQVLRYADIVFGNESEAAAFAEANALGTTDVAEIAIKIAQWSKSGSRPRTVVITQGSEPTIVATSVSDKTQSYPVIAISKEKIVDTNGAGDAFVGGYLSQLVRGRDVKQCIAAANYLANLVIQRSGATYPHEKCTFE